MTQSADQQTSITLSTDEAVVIDALLARWQGEGPVEISHPSERRALWNLHARLEKVLVEPFSSNYAHVLAAARTRLTDAEP